MIEREKRYLAKYLPAELTDCNHEEILDIYIPATESFPRLRARKFGKTLELTKKEWIKSDDLSTNKEHSIPLNENEYLAIKNSVEGKEINKIRYYYQYSGLNIEFNVFKGRLSGLVVIEVEFKTEEEKESFRMPDFCLADVTNENFINGGMLSGKSYEEIQNVLNKFNYMKLMIE